jgi:hypothetical protein
MPPLAFRWRQIAKGGVESRAVVDILDDVCVVSQARRARQRADETGEREALPVKPRCESRDTVGMRHVAGAEGRHSSPTRSAVGTCVVSRV